MSIVLTLVASDPDRKPLTDRHTGEIIKLIDLYDIRPTCQPVWIRRGKAAEIGISGHGGTSMMYRLREFLADSQIDIFITPIKNRRKKVMLADMDSTIVTGETLDDLAEHAGIKDQVAEITARAMNGELDFHAAIEKRVRLLKGLPQAALEKTLENMTYSPGAASLVKTLREGGAHCVLVSGGFTFFTGAVARELGFINHHGNELDIADDVLTGHVKKPILDKDSKVQFLRQYADLYNLSLEHCMAIGDGANDIPMLKAAGLGIGYKPKEAVAKEIENLIIYGDLSAALYVQGYAHDDIIFP